jgi:hypothetical protein
MKDQKLNQNASCSLARITPRIAFDVSALVTEGAKLTSPISAMLGTERGSGGNINFSIAIVVQGVMTGGKVSVDPVRDISAEQRST